MKIILVVLFLSTVSSFAQTSGESQQELVEALKTDLDTKEYANLIYRSDILLEGNNLGKEQLIKVYELRASAYFYIKGYSKAIENTNKQIDLIQFQKGREVELYYAYEKLCKLYEGLHRQQESIKARKHALEIVKNLNDQFQILANNNLGHSYLTVSNDSALFYFNAGIERYNQIAEPTENETILYNVLQGNLGYVHLLEGDTSGIRTIQKSLNYLDAREGEIENQLRFRVYLGEQLYLLKEYRRSLQFLNEAVVIASKSDNWNYTEKIIQRQLLAHSALGDTKEVQRLNKELENVNFQLEKLDQSEQLHAELMNLKISKINRENVLLELEQTHAQEKRWLYGALLVGLIVFILIYSRILFRKNKGIFKLKSALLETQLTKESAEVEHLKELFEHHRVEFDKILVKSRMKDEQLEKLIMDLRRMKNDSTSSINETLSDIQIKLNSLRNDSVSPNKGVSGFDFLQILKSKHPELNTAELEICSMLYSGLENKEISNLKNVTSKSVGMSKYRLKKKLGLDKSLDLETYLKGLND